MLRSLYRRLKMNHYARRHVFPYFGENLHFPPDSYVFTKACEEGIYEHAYLALLQFSIRPNTWYFDVGANIGLMSAPLLSTEVSLNVVSIEASPTTSSCITRSAAESINRARWHVVAKAVGEKSGRLSFHANPSAGGAFDGLEDTGRIAGGSKVEVEVTTLDQIWTDCGRPEISAVKIDVEGAEPQVLMGARSCLAQTRPVILVECNAINLAAYGHDFGTILIIADELKYDVVSIPAFCPVTNATAFRYQSRVNENFLLMPRS
jgi:FkbM family methyltransferase